MAKNITQPKLQDDVFTERVRFLKEFLEANTESDINYRTEIRRLLDNNEKRLIINLNGLRRYHAENSERLLDLPNEWIPPFEKALKEVAINIQDPTKHNVEDQRLYVGFTGNFRYHINPGTLRSFHLGKLISIEGIVSRCSLVRLKLAKSVHYCEKTGVFYFKEYQDSTTIGNHVPTPPGYPTEDENGNPLTTEFGYSVYRDHQTICLQEMPEKAHAGQLLRSVDVVLDDDLVDKVKPGDRIQLAGCYRAIGKPAQGSSSATFRTVIVATNITILSGDVGRQVITDKDIENIEKFRKDPNIFEKLSRSLAPSIFGHDIIKKAILLMLLGGKEQNLSSGTHIRGDINILMVGDPSTAKSQLLRRVLNIAPLAIATTGRGSSGVGLTAAVTRDKETGERCLEAGAMVLGDRGVVCIDEFDKMTDIDRVAIHEVMEQQTVTIAKAGIHTSLNARCSVIAAANPVYGQYDVYKNPAQNIALPDSLLSRFDLVFVVTDTLNDRHDRDVSQHVLRLHQYRPHDLEEGVPIKEDSGQTLFMEQNENSARPTSIYQQYNLQTDANNNGQEEPDLRSDRLFSSEFLQKYIQYAKSREEPKLGKRAADYICGIWTSLRNEVESDNFKTSPMTPRALDSLFRLATAHAKARLARTVTKADALVAEEIVKFALFKKVEEKRNKKHKPTVISDDEEDDSSGDDSSSPNDDIIDIIESRKIKKKQNRRPRISRKDRAVSNIDSSSDAELHQQGSSTENALIIGDEREDEASNQAGSSSSMNHPMDTDEPQNRADSILGFDTLDLNEIDGITSSRLKQFQDLLHQVTSRSDFDGQKLFDSLMEEINETLPEDQKFSKEEAEAALNVMAKKNKVMYTGGIVYTI
ncbi:14721_t:CDS:10 [Acaulospora morrowiae]|uniref:DNA replication licensing factor MCM3 n=1 Tax=Acaulospora morrowiae TaxID=94023 RepID=A0A9N8V369_9GLOM|nr:14721_t:CDS:10 [Acaulospora morrowiae]